MAPTPNGRRNAQNRHLDVPIAKTRRIGSFRLRNSFSAIKTFYGKPTNHKTIPSDPTASDCPISRMDSTLTQKFIILHFCRLYPPSDHFRFLETRGLTGGDVRRAIYFQAAYQSVMRTSICDPINQDPKRIVVPDLHLAEYLQSKFLGSQIDKIDIGIDEVMTSTLGRPRKHQSNRERVAEQRKKAQDKRI